jgi:hypothetical protein
MTIQRTIDIPADRKIQMILPENVPSGKVEVVLEFKPAAAAGVKPVCKSVRANPPVDLREARIALAWNSGRTDDSSRKYAGCLKGKNIFTGDPVAIQRKMRAIKFALQKKFREFKS